MTICALLAAIGPVAAQTGMRVGVDPPVVAVGEPFRVVAEAAGSAGAPLVLTVRLDSAGAFELRGSPDADPAAGVVWATLVAWRTGPAGTLPATLSIGGRRIAIELPTPLVRSVLPDSGEIRPRPARDVIGPDREPVWWAILAAGVALLVGAALLAARSRRSRAAPVPRAADARGEALRALDALRGGDLLTRGDVRRFYEATAEILRGYAAAASVEWSRDLTTDELLGRLRADAAPAVSSLAEVLTSADRAKFAGRHGDAADALREWEVARGWVAGQRSPGGA